MGKATWVKAGYMDDATWETGERAVTALKDQYFYNGNEIKDKLRNSYIEKALPARTELIDYLLKQSGRQKIPYAALEDIVDYHAANDEDKEIPQKLSAWVFKVQSKRVDKPIHEPEYMREITQRHRLIIHSMIVLVDFEGWKERQALILTAKIVSRSPEAVYKVWQTADKNRDNPDIPGYMGFFKYHAGEGAEKVYQAWKKEGYPVYVASV